MKYSMSNLEFAAPGEATFKVENISVEYSVEELAQFAINAIQIIGAVKEAVKELTPVISSEIEKHQKLQHSYAMERAEQEVALQS